MEIYFGDLASLLRGKSVMSAGYPLPQALYELT